MLKHGADATHCDKEGSSVLGAATAGRCNDDLVLALLAVNGSPGLVMGNPLGKSIGTSVGYIYI